MVYVHIPKPHVDIKLKKSTKRKVLSLPLDLPQAKPNLSSFFFLNLEV